MVGILGLSGRCFADSAYIEAYGKAEAEYSHWLSESIRSGARPSADERKAKHKELFADAHKAYIQDETQLQKKMIELGKQFMRDLKNYNPPAKQLTNEEKEKYKDAPIDFETGDNKDGLKKLASHPSRSIARVADKPATDAKEPVTRDKAGGDVKSGAADLVSFKNDGKGGAPNTHGPAPASVGDVGGGTAVDFNTAPKEDPKYKIAKPGNGVDVGGGTPVDFNAGDAPAAAPKKSAK